jgi:uncharacterized membrane protein YfcA
LDLFSLSWVVALFVVFFAAFVRGVSGFGFALVSAPALLLIWSPKSVVAINLLLGIPSSLFQLGYAFRGIDLRKILPLATGSLLGIPLGIYIIKEIAPSALKVLIGGLTLFFAIPLILGLGAAFRREWLASGIFGFLSGILSSSTSLGGPPVVLFVHNQKWRKEVIYSGLAVYFLFVCVCSIGAFLISGLIDMEAVVGAASLLPALLVGLGLGMVVFSRVNAELFRRFSIAVVIAAGVLGVLSGSGVIS